MKIKKELLADIRVFKAPILAEEIIKLSQISELVQLSLDENHLLSSRAAWVLAHCSDKTSNSIKPFYSQLILNLKNEKLHNGVIRNTLRLFQENEVPIEYQSFMLDKCYQYIKNPFEAIAVRSFAITVAFKISKPYPELLKELELLLQHLRVNDTSPGMISKIKHTLKLIHKLNSK